ncbi:MAG TPA: sigma-70 family RNA polymerase sigma factor [Gemmata sp.]
MRTVAALCRELLPDPRSDGELLAAFTADRAEGTFLELVRRHGPLVWDVCRRVLPDPADAEDVFQATFLVLVGQANKLVSRDALGPWLHRVAVLTARNVRRKNARRLARQRELPEDVPTSTPNPDLKADLDGALLGLPARYREPIILCHLQGFTRREAAERLGCAEGTLSAWLNRGLAKLRVRLRALDPAQALSAPAVALPAALITTTVRAAVVSGTATATVPPAVSALIEGVLHMLWIKKATAAAFALCAVFVMGVGVGLGTRPGSTGAGAQDDPTKPAGVTKPAPPAAPVAADDKRIEEMTARIREAENQLLLKKALLEASNQKLALEERLNPNAKRSAEDRETLRRLGAEVKVSEAELQVLKAELANLTANKPAPVAPANDKEARARQRLGLQSQLIQLTAERAELLAQADVAKQKLAVTEERLRELRQLTEQLDAQAGPTKRAGGYLVLTVGGTAAAPEYALRELEELPVIRTLPKKYRLVSTSDAEMIAKLITRAKADPNGPRNVLVGVEPQTVLGAGAQKVLDACDAAGYKTVTFTGYVFGGGFAVPLKPDQAGEVRGYKRYDQVEVKPKQLAEEIKEGLRRL